MTGFVRRLAGASLVYGLGGVLSRMVSLLLLPVFTRYLTPADYGVIAMLGVMTNLLLGAVTLGAGNSMGICFHEGRDARERSAVVWSTCSLIALSVAAWLVVGSALADVLSIALFGVDSHATAVRLALGQLAASALAMPLLGRWRLEEQARPFVIATLGLTAATAAANVFAVVGLERGLLGMLWSTFLVQSVYCIVLYVVFSLRDPPRAALSWMKRVARLGWPSIFGVGAFFLLDFGGRLILNWFEGLHALGVYSIGVSLGLGMSIVAEGAFGAAWPAFFLSYYNRREEAGRVFGLVLQYYLAVFLALASGFFLLAGPVVRLMAAEPFQAAANVVGLIALCSVLRGAYLIFLPGLYYQQKLHIQTALEWFGAIVGVLSCAALAPALGLVGAALGTLAGYAALCGAAIRVSRRYLPIQVNWRRAALLCGAFAAAAGFSFLELATSEIVDWTLRGAAFLAFCLLMVFVLARGDFRNVLQELRAQ